jgi:branched-subunit amino acid aminotransferase/4-amino-4-deoxychorismate lyase
VKSLSYAANMLATRMARERGFHEALLVTPHGRVLEGPTSSLFWAAGDGALCTTPLSERVLASITRRRLMELVEVEERVITSDELLRASEAFLASTTHEVHPIHRIEDVEFEAPGPRSRAADEAFAAHLRELRGR